MKSDKNSILYLLTSSTGLYSTVATYVQPLVKLCLGFCVSSHVFRDATVEVLLPLAHKLLVQLWPTQVVLVLLSTDQNQ